MLSRSLRASLRFLPSRASSSSPNADILHKATVEPSLLKPFVSSPLQSDDFFDIASHVHVDEMFASRLHFGHKVGTLHEKMKWALFGERLGVCIFDLEVTCQHLVRALEVVAHISMRGGIILFVSTQRETMFEVERMAEESGQYSHTRKWQEGTLTNTRQLLGASVRLPDLIVLLSCLSHGGSPHPCIVEGAKMAIPTIGVVDSNADPSHLTYLIPANDDSPQSVEYLLRMFRFAIHKGVEARKKMIS